MRIVSYNVNGIRAAIIDLHKTNPIGWENDCRPPLNNFSDIVIYELHHRDFSIDFSSGIIHKGKFLALTEEDTKTYYGEKTGIEHLKELGVTHVHLLPSFDFGSIPPVSIIVNSLFNHVISAYILSLVTPGVSSTIERRSPISLLKSVDFPTLGLPTIATMGFAILTSPFTRRLGHLQNRSLLHRRRVF